jgi:hypothetical protein
VRFNVKYGADLIKFCASGGVMSLADEVDTPQLTRDEMTALVDEAHRLRKRVAAHCHGDRAAGDAIAAGVDSIEHGTFLHDETLEAMKANGVYLVPTLLVQNQLGRQLDRLPPELAVKARQAIEAAPAMVRRALEIGVKDGGDDEWPEPLCWVNSAIQCAPGGKRFVAHNRVCQQVTGSDAQSDAMSGIGAGDQNPFAPGRNA